MEHNQTEMKRLSSIASENPSLADLITRLEEETGDDADSLNLFEWIIEDLYEDKLDAYQDYFKDRPDLLKISNDEVLHELDMMLSYFEENERYEKCARLVKIMETIKRAMSEGRLALTPSLSTNT